MNKAFQPGKIIPVTHNFFCHNLVTYNYAMHLKQNSILLQLLSAVYEL